MWRFLDSPRHLPPLQRPAVRRAKRSGQPREPGSHLNLDAVVLQVPWSTQGPRCAPSHRVRSLPRPAAGSALPPPPSCVAGSWIRPGGGDQTQHLRQAVAKLCFLIWRGGRWGARTEDRAWEGKYRAEGSEETRQEHLRDVSRSVCVCVCAPLLCVIPGLERGSSPPSCSHP